MMLFPSDMGQPIRQPAYERYYNLFDDSEPRFYLFEDKKSFNNKNAKCEISSTNSLNLMDGIFETSPIIVEADKNLEKDKLVILEGDVKTPDNIGNLDDVIVIEEFGAGSDSVCQLAEDDDDGSYGDRRANYACQLDEMERLGMTVTSGSVTIRKDQSNLIGISIGGGAPLCPCLYIVQIFDNTPAAREGTLQSGDEIVGINATPVKGKTKVEVAKMIQSATTEVIVNYNKLHADPVQGESLDIVLKKIKHRLVEAMSSSTADTLGLSRAILCNDSLVKRLQELQSTEFMYKNLVDHAKRMLKAYFDLLQTFQAFGNIFAAISVREPQPRASEAFRLFSEMHRNMEKDGVKMLKIVKPVLSDLGTYLNKAIPDTKMTIRKYADAKFTYLSYCLKVKEMDDEEHSYAALQEPLYRIETGNYEYRLILRCRQEARGKFAKLRNDVLEKMELLESKHARDLAGQLKRFIDGLANLGMAMVGHLREHPNLFPVEVDLKESAFQYKSAEIFHSENHEDDDEVLNAEEALENSTNLDNIRSSVKDIQLQNETFENSKLLAELGLENINLSENIGISGLQQGNLSNDLLQ